MYSHTADLLILAGRMPLPPANPVPGGWNLIQTPMSAETWERHLVEHPDRMYCGYLTEGIRAGFQVGFQYGVAACRSATSNMPSATLHPEVVTNFLSAELRAGRVFGPIESEVLPYVQINRFGLEPKGHQPGRWRLIVDLSSPNGASVNDGIEPEVCSVHYTSVVTACKRVVARGRGTLLAKFDVEGAFRTVPVHPNDRWLLGMKWEDKVYVDKVLPFGLRSAPK